MDTYLINKEKLLGAYETVSSVETCLENKDILSSFEEMDEYLQNVNFEHGNSIRKYKKNISMIEDDILQIKKEISNLSSSLERTISTFQVSEEESTRNMRNLTSKYEVKNDIAEVINHGVNNEIDGVPIGIGIAAAGVTGAAGAIFLDSLSGHKKQTIEDYKPPKEEEPVDLPQKRVLKEFEDPSPYYAVRDTKLKDKFYSDDNSDEEKY